MPFPSSARPGKNDILIDARMRPHTGIGRYITEISKRLPGLDPSTDFRFIIASDGHRQIINPDGRMPNVRWILDRTSRYTVKDHLNIIRNLSATRPAVFHSMNYIMPPVKVSPTVVTIYDVIRLRLPETFLANPEYIRRFGWSRFIQLSALGLLFFPFLTARDRRLKKYISADLKSMLDGCPEPNSHFKMHHLFQAGILQMVARMANSIITISNYSRNDICRLFPVLESKIQVVYGAASGIFMPIHDKDELAASRRRYELPDRFVLYIGPQSYHKNLHGLMRAFASLIGDNEFKDVQLVTVGKEDPVEGRIPRLIREFGLEGRVAFTGPVPDRDLVHIYNLATVIVLPAFYEGYGLPAIEAMACGTPVIASSSTVLPEIVGQGALLVNPSSLIEMVKALRSVLLDKNLRNRLKSAGLRRSREFSWDVAAEKTLQIYQSVSAT